MEQIIECSESGQTLHFGMLDPVGGEVAFDTLWRPAVIVGETILRFRAEQLIESACTPDGIEAFKSLLLERISEMSVEATYHEFDSYRGDRRTELGSAAYEMFCHPGRLRLMFESYPVLARLLAQAVVQWVDLVEEFCHRFVADREEVARLSDGGKVDVEADSRRTRVSSVMPLSEVHDQGRVVLRVTLESLGRNVIYKPRSLRAEEAFARFARWIEQDELMLRQKFPEMIVRSDYGWVETVFPSPCVDEQAARRYFRRSGSLLNMLYMVGAVDCHRENVVACGEYPILIDLETILHASVTRSASTPEASELTVARSTLLRTGMLPFGDGPSAFHDSGICMPAGTVERIGPTRWAECNTDRMRPAGVSVDESRTQNQVFLLDRAVSGHDYSEEIVEGFREGYRSILKRQDDLLREDGPLSLFRKLRVRFVFRSTKAYASLAWYSLRAGALRGGTSRSILFERLYRAILARGAFALSPIVAHEIRSLEQSGIPILWASTEDPHVDAGGRIVEYVADDRPVEEMRRRVRALSEEQLNCHVATVLHCFKR